MYGARNAGPDRLIRTDDEGAFFTVDGIGMPERAFPWVSWTGSIDKKSCAVNGSVASYPPVRRDD